MIAVSAFPSTRAYPLKSKLLNLTSKIFISDARIVSSVRFVGQGEFRIGKDTFIGHRTILLNGGSTISIGNYVDISSNVTFISGSHVLGDPNIRSAGEGYSKNITIGDRVWVGASVTILSGVTVGEGAIIGAGTIVNKNVPANSIVCGNPFKVVKTWCSSKKQWKKYED